MLRVFTTFSGYDSQCLALERLGLDYTLVGWSEIDKYAIQAHDALFPESKAINYGDITKIDWTTVPDFDLFTYSSPCQDFSQAGKQLGGEKGSGTRSSLLWECERAIKAKRPKFLLMENVAALVTSKFIKLFNKWQRTLEQYGYSNFAKVLNAKNFGVPQNRERIFVVSILNGGRYYFPEPIRLGKKLKDILEHRVDETFYLKSAEVNMFEKHRQRNKEKGNGFGWNPTDGNSIARALDTKSDRCSSNYIKEKNTCVLTQKPKLIAEDLAPAQQSLLVKEATSQGYAEVKPGGVFDASYPKSTTRRGRVQGDGGNISPTLTTENTIRVYDPTKIVMPINIAADGSALCLKSSYYRMGRSNFLDHSSDGFKATAIIESTEIKYKGKTLHEGDGLYTQSSEAFNRGALAGLSRALKAATHDAAVVHNFRIRKLTPRECFRLMGVDDADIDKIQASGISNSQQYKLAGNSIVVDVLAAIFRKMFVDKKNESQQLSLF